MALAPVLPPLHRESTVSWCSRIARFHADMACADWLGFMEISQQSVINTTDSCVERLSRLTGIAEDRVRATGIETKGERMFCHRSVPFGAYFGQRPFTTYCPACLLEDMAKGSHSRGERVGRVSWMFNPVRICARHGTVLVRRRNAGHHELFQDMNRVAPDADELEQQARDAETDAVSPLQAYVEARFDGLDGPEWLDGQQIDQATRACEILGACLLLGVHADIDRLSMREWNQAGAAGFTYAAKGPQGIREAMEELAQHAFCRNEKGGPQAVFGRLYKWLHFNKAAKDPGPVKDVVRDHILDMMPVEPGKMLLGKRVERFHRHSITSLSKQSGVHPRTLRFALFHSGIVPRGEERKYDHQIGFDAGEGEALAHRIRHSIPITKIPAYLNCNRTQAVMLVRQGILRPLMPDFVGHSILHNVSYEEMDAFLTRFRSCGRQVSRPGAGMMDVIKASEVARETATDIASMVLDGDLQKVEILDEALRFRSVLVDPVEVRSVMEAKADRVGLSVRDAAARLGVPQSGIGHLRNTVNSSGEPLLRGVELTNARGTVRYRYPEEEIEKFKAEHVTLNELALERGLTVKFLAKRLSDANVSPIMDRDLLRVTMFRRSDL